MRVETIILIGKEICSVRDGVEGVGDNRVESLTDEGLGKILDQYNCTTHRTLIRVTACYEIDKEKSECIVRLRSSILSPTV